MYNYATVANEIPTSEMNSEIALKDLKFSEVWNISVENIFRN